MTKDEALDLALDIQAYNSGDEKYTQAITAIKQARSISVQEPDLAKAYREELDKLSQRNYELRMENARLIAPVQEPVAWVRWEWNRSGLRSLTFSKPAELPLAEEATGVVYDPLYTTPPAAQPAFDLQAELEATNRQVEILSDALAESRREVAQLKAQPAPVQEPVAWTDEQMLKMWHEEHDAHKKTSSFAWYKAGLKAANKTTPPAAQRPWVGLTDDEIDKTQETQVWDARRSYARAIEAKLREKNNG